MQIKQRPNVAKAPTFVGERLKASRVWRWWRREAGGFPSQDNGLLQDRIVCSLATETYPNDGSDVQKYSNPYTGVVAQFDHYELMWRTTS